VAITFVGRGTGQTGTTATTAPTVHASTVNGDVILYPFIEARVAGLGAAPTDPGGIWTKQHQSINDLTVGAGTIRLTLYSAVYAGAAIPFPTKGSTTPTHITNVFSFRDVDTTTNDGVEAVGTVSENAAATSIASGGVTTLTNGAMVVAFGQIADNWGTNVAGYNITTDINTLGTISGVTFAEAVEANTSDGADAGHVVNYGEKATAGAVSAGTFTWATNTPLSTQSLGLMVALKPTGGGGAATSLPPGQPHRMTSSLYGR
jgi:hypothetical protein